MNVMSSLNTEHVCMYVCHAFRLCLWNWWLLSEIWKLAFAKKA